MINQQRHYWRSLAGGEIAPEMYGRVDLAKHQTGVQRCYNFGVTPQGAVENRSGTRFIATTKSNGEAWLEAFVRADGQGFLLEMGENYIRVHNAGTFVTEMATPYAFEHIKAASTAQFVNDMSICHPNYAPSFVRRISDTSWSFSAISFNATLPAPSGVTATPHEIKAMDVDDPRISYRYVVSSLDENNAESGPSSPAAANNVLRIAGNNNTITWSPVTGAVRYNVYAARGQGSYGYIGSSEGTTFVDDNINPDNFVQPPETLVDFSTSGNYPSAVVFHEQRCIFANTLNDPQSFWASGLAGFGYFKASYPPQDDQAFTYELSAKKAAPILHMMALRDVLFFTASGVFRVYTATGEPFTPSNVSAIPVSSYGAAANVRPQEVGNAILFPVERGSHVFALKYDGSGEGYTADDLSLIAPHLIEGYSWVQSALQRAPYPVWWGLRNDGKLIGVTYISEQQVLAWQQWELPGGFIESIAAVPEGARDALYCVVRRTVASNTVRYIERFEPRFGGQQSQDQAYFLDCGITYTGPATNTVTGLNHLEGLEVMVLADGRPLGPYTVGGGMIVIDEEAETIHVGLPYVSELETLPLAYEQPGYGVGVEKNISAVYVRVKRSAGLEAGPDFEHLRPMMSPVDELLGDVPQLRDGVHQIDVDNEWSPDAAVVIRQALPLPATITGLAVDYVSAE